MICSVCNGELVALGVLGSLEHFRCRHCGLEHSKRPQESSCRVCLYGCGCEYLHATEGIDCWSPRPKTKEGRELFKLAMAIDIGQCPHFEEG